ncbi:uncharacterized protein [Nicotiana sylvestris]|uniref:uncharacterized protein n=1 Tax=Nicotiana sylvestris TaxID=4096 RepID=UPI00388C73A3
MAALERDMTGLQTSVADLSTCIDVVVDRYVKSERKFMGQNMSSTQNAPAHDSEGLGENNGIGLGVPPVNSEGVPNVEPVDISYHNALNMEADAEPVRNECREAHAGGQEARRMEEGGVSLQVIFEMLQAQQVAIAQLQSQNRTSNTAEPVNMQHELVLERLDESSSGTNPTIMKMLEELTKRIELREKKIEANDRKYNGTTDPNEHITAYTRVVKGNDLKDDEIESVLLKKFGETLSKGVMMWYHNLPPNSMDSFVMLADSFVKAHAGAIKVATRKSDVFKIKQRENAMLRVFVSRFKMERMELPPVSNNWAVQAYTQGLNERSSIALKQLKQTLIKYPAMSWADAQYVSIEDQGRRRQIESPFWLNISKQAPSKGIKVYRKGVEIRQRKVSATLQRLKRHFESEFTSK